MQPATTRTRPAKKTTASGDRFAHSTRDYLATVTLASTDIPGEIHLIASPGLSNTIFTGTRWTTFTKLPVAFSGGKSANTDPVPRCKLSTWPFNLRCG